MRQAMTLEQLVRRTYRWVANWKLRQIAVTTVVLVVVIFVVAAVRNAAEGDQRAACNVARMLFDMDAAGTEEEQRELIARAGPDCF